MKILALFTVLFVCFRLYSQGDEGFITLPNTEVVYVLTQGGALERLEGAERKMHVTFEYCSYQDWVYPDQTNGKLLIKWLLEYEAKIQENPADNVDSITLLRTNYYSMISHRKPGTDDYELMSSYDSTKSTVNSENDSSQLVDVDEMVNVMLDDVLKKMYISSTGKTGVVWKISDQSPNPMMIELMIYRGNGSPISADFLVTDTVTSIYCNDEHLFVVFKNDQGQIILDKYDLNGTFVSAVAREGEDVKIFPTTSPFYFKKDLVGYSLFSLEGEEVFSTSFAQMSTQQKGYMSILENERIDELVYLQNDGQQCYRISGYPYTNGQMTFSGNTMLFEEVSPPTNNAIYWYYINGWYYPMNYETRKTQFIWYNKETRSWEAVCELSEFIWYSRNLFASILNSNKEHLKYFCGIRQNVEFSVNTVSATVKNLPESYNDREVTGRLLETIYRDNNPNEVYEVLSYDGLSRPVIGTSTEFVIIPKLEGDPYRIPRVSGNEGFCVRQYLLSSANRFYQDSLDKVTADAPIIENDRILRVNYAKSGTILFAHKDGVTHELIAQPANLIPTNPRPLVDGMLGLGVTEIELYQKGEQTYALHEKSINAVTSLAFTTEVSYDRSIDTKISKRVIDDFSNSPSHYTPSTFHTGLTNGVAFTENGKMRHAYWNDRSEGNPVYKLNSENLKPFLEREQYLKDLFRKFGGDQSDLDLIQSGRFYIVTNSDKTFLWMGADVSEFFELGGSYKRSLHPYFKHSFTVFGAEKDTLLPYIQAVQSESCSDDTWLALRYQGEDYYRLVNESTKQIKIINFTEYQSNCEVWNIAFKNPEVLRSARSLKLLSGVVYAYATDASIHRMTTVESHRMGIYSEQVSDRLLIALFNEMELARTWKKDELLTKMELIGSGNNMLRVSMDYFDAKPIDVLFFQQQNDVKRIFMMENSMLPNPAEMLKQLHEYRPVNSDYIWEIFPLESGTFAYSRDTLHHLQVDLTKSRKIGEIIVPRAYPTLVEEFFTSLADAANAHPNFGIEENFCLCSPEYRYPATVTRFMGATKKYEIITIDNPENQPLHFSIEGAPIHLSEPNRRSFVSSTIELMVKTPGAENVVSARTEENDQSIITTLKSNYYHWIPANPTQRRLFGLNKIDTTHYSEANLLEYLSKILALQASETFEYREYFTDSLAKLDPIMVLRASSDNVYHGFQNNVRMKTNKDYHVSRLDTIPKLSENYWAWIVKNPDLNGYSFNKNMGSHPYILTPTQLVRFTKNEGYSAVFYKINTSNTDSTKVSNATTYLQKLLSLKIPANETVELFAMNKNGFVVIKGTNSSNYEYYVQAASVPTWESKAKKVDHFKLKMEAKLESDEAQLKNDIKKNSKVDALLKVYWKAYYSANPPTDTLRNLTLGGDNFEFSTRIYLMLYGN